MLRVWCGGDYSSGAARQAQRAPRLLLAHACGCGADVRVVARAAGQRARTARKHAWIRVLLLISKRAGHAAGGEDAWHVLGVLPGTVVFGICRTFSPYVGVLADRASFQLRTLKSSAH